MKKMLRRSVAVLTAFVFLFTGTFMYNGTREAVFADVGPATSGQDITYSTGGGLLESTGFDTSKLPESYDANSTENPYGSDVTTMTEMSELVKIDTKGGSAASSLYGHKAPLDGNYATLNDSGESNGAVEGPGEQAYIAGTGVDVTGSGRKSAVAIVYTNYKHQVTDDADRNINLMIYDPTSPSQRTTPITISSFESNPDMAGYGKLAYNFHIQSQLQIAAGDFDNDTVDEIAVYVPSPDGKQAPRIAIYDLTNGRECLKPYEQGSWQNSWNYVLPTYSSKFVKVEYERGLYMSNFYNCLDLAAGDADNDGSCDLVVSYGATDDALDSKDMREILNSLPSRSVILYGSNGSPEHGGQMLKDAQELTYGDDPLIRVAFAFGDLDGDGNEEMILGGQRQSEQDSNTTRVLGKYIYDKSSGGMIVDNMQNMTIVSGAWTKDNPPKFNSSNGWDGNYYSVPLMKTNIAVGNIMGKGSDTRIYLDSVLYSYDGNSFDLEDELEDTSFADPDDHDKGMKGSAVFTDFKGLGDSKEEQVQYYEYGAKAANYTGSEADYVVVHRTSLLRPGATTDELKAKRIISDASMLVAEEDNDGNLKLTAKHEENEYESLARANPVTKFAADSDIDSAVCTYTGNHKIEYQDPKVLAVLASAPYFKDVADYDNGKMLSGCKTTYGESKGDGTGSTSSVDLSVGLYTNNQFAFGAKAFGIVNLVGWQLNAGAGYKYTRNVADNWTNKYDVTYGASAGENEVVLFSTPIEKYEYNVMTGALDEDGNVTTEAHKQWIARPHQPVTQTMSMEDYMEIQKQNTKELPDVTKYVTSKPGYPSTYPSGKSDLPKAVADSWTGHSAHDELSNDETITEDGYVEYREDAWMGAGYGTGYIIQSLTWSKDHSESDAHGGYFSFDTGPMWKTEAEAGAAASYQGGAGLHFAIGGSDGVVTHDIKGTSCSGMVANMPRSAKGYGYDFSWSLLKYKVRVSKECIFPVITYMVKDVQQPPKLPEAITQDFDNTTDKQIGLSWTYTEEAPAYFEVYRYKDFPQGGGDELVGKVMGSDYKVRKDNDGNTITDSNGKTIREYSFVEDDLTADTKYSYRLKAIRETPPTDSIFSPVVTARTDVSEKPKLSLTTDNLTIYPDTNYTVFVNLDEDPSQYEKTKDYQWQKYNTKEHQWEDMSGRETEGLLFSNCKNENAGQYRCRVNLVRKRESNPQYISTFTDILNVEFGRRDVKFGPISVYDGTGTGPYNTGISVKVSNSSSTGTAKPTGSIEFTMAGPNGDLQLSARIDPQTGVAKIDSIEDQLSTLGQQAFANGGYRITASYGGDNVFNPKEDPDDYHYLRNIDECIWLSTSSGYYFGEDIMPTTYLYDYKRQPNGSVTRTDITDQIKTLKIFETDGQQKTNTVPIATFNRGDDKSIIATIPLDERLKKRAWVEAYTDGSEPAAHQVILTTPMQTTISLSGKYSGAGSSDTLFHPFAFNGEDITITGGGSFDDTITFNNGAKTTTLKDLLKFRYYEANGSWVCDSISMDKTRFIPARYRVTLAAKSKNDIVKDPNLKDIESVKSLIKTFYAYDTPDTAEFTVVGSYYEVTANALDPGTGRVRIVAPEIYDEVDHIGFSGGYKITLRAYPATGFEVKGWKIYDGQGGTLYQSGGEQLIYTLRSDPTNSSTEQGEEKGQVKIIADIQPRNNTLTYSAKGKGKLTVSPNFASGDTVLEGTDLTFSATADEGWTFKEWRWENYGGNSSVSTGNLKDGVNTKTFKMGANPANVYAVFAKDAIDMDLEGNLVASYINDGSNPLEEDGKEVSVDKGKGIPKGTRVRVKTAPGFVLEKNATWDVSVTTTDGPAQVNVEEFQEDSTEGVTFLLPENVTACSVKTKTEKGRFFVDLAGNPAEIGYEVKLDGTKVPKEKMDEALAKITAGTLIEVQAVPVRGQVFDHWLIDGDEQKTKNQTLSFAVKDNVVIEAAVTKDTEHKLTISGEGGTGLCTITDHNGDTVKKTFKDSTEITVFDGESLTICSDPNDTEHIMTSLKMAKTVQGLKPEDLKSQQLTEGVFVLDKFTEDTTIAATFRPTTYHVVSFRSAVKDADFQILDSTGRPLDLDDTLEVGHNDTVEFSVVMDSHYPCVVTSDNGKLKTEGQQGTYNCKLSDVDQNAVITIDNRFVIDSWDRFREFMDKLPDIGSMQQLQAVVTKDIDAEGGSFSPYLGEFKGTLDGQGHTIRNVRLGSSNSPYDGHSYLFATIAESGCVKNLTIEDYQAFLVEPPMKDQVNSLIAKENYGTISGVSLIDCAISRDTEDINRDRCEMAGIAGGNAGTIQGCQVIGLKLKAWRDMFTAKNVGCAGVLQNHIEKNPGYIIKGRIIGCYFESLQCWNENPGAYVESDDNIVADRLDIQQQGTFQGNYYRVVEGVGNDQIGINVNTIASAEDQNKPEFAANLACHLNEKLDQKLWGIKPPADPVSTSQTVTPAIFPLGNGDETCKAPVKATYNTEGTDPVTEYLYPGEHTLLGAETFGSKTPKYWQNDDNAYTPGYGPVVITKDVEFTGIKDLPAKCVATLSSGKQGNASVVCYNELKDALDAASTTTIEKPVVTVIGKDCAMEEGYTISDGMTVTVNSGAKLTLKKAATITIADKGTFTVADGATLEKYSVINNSGTINVLGTFNNYGSRLLGDGDVVNRNDIHCSPHIKGNWLPDAEPNADDNTWINTQTCEVCENDYPKTFEPDPDVDKIRSIEVYQQPEKLMYKAGDQFTTSKMIIAANLDDGAKAVLTSASYKMTIADVGQKGGQEIHDGDYLMSKGTKVITVSDGGFEVDFVISITSSVTAIDIADGERDVYTGGTLQLAAVVTPADAPDEIQWVSANKAVATVDKNGLVTGVAPGQTQITAAAGELTATCIVTVHDPVESMELDKQEMQLQKNGSGVIAATVKPATADDIITWTVSDNSVAGFIVTDETTGEKKIVDTVKTRLEKNGSISSAFVSVAGIGTGETTITASVVDREGKLLREQCRVEVSEIPAVLSLYYNGKEVSGSAVTIDKSKKKVRFEAISSDPDDVLKWATIDQNDDPVISVDSVGNVTLLRSGTAAISVTSQKTGSTDSCIIKVVNMPRYLSLSASRTKLARNNVKVLTAKLYPADADGGIVWKSSNEKVAVVSADGVVTGIREGKAVIAVRAVADHSLIAKCVVTVLEPRLKIYLSKNAFYYNGKEQYPDVTVLSGRTVLAKRARKSNNDVLIIFDGGRLLPGKYNVTATGVEEGMGTVEGTYRILVKPTKIKKIKKGKRKFTLTWQTYKRPFVTGYQIRYSKNKNMAKSKYKLIKKHKKGKLTVRHLKAKKTYYVQIRTYKKISGKKFYSTWSRVKKVKTK